MIDRITDPTIARSANHRLRAAQHRVLQLGSRPPRGADPRIYAARPWYHEFAELGVQTDFSGSQSVGERLVGVVRRVAGRGQLGGQLNQRVKDAQILPALTSAVSTFTERCGQPPSTMLDLFAADGYYSFWAIANLGIERATCVDLRAEYLAQGQLMAEVLGTRAVTFRNQDVFDLDATRYDVALCAGGLYHVTDPEQLLRMLGERATVLVAQSIVTTHTEDPSYFVSPAPTLAHGCRFTHGFFRQMLERTGWEIVGESTGLVDGPRDEWSRGSSQFLCVR